ncbi:hypothetical protein [Paracidovorax anthurii]|uniref:Uncharacterized protein n=1 Tax=Paracidovorax anthurii TaxID=78229 RepID=A0A328YGC7_9BURK|nr:hypothetical protein [Paracidovorax anthurii]RAR72690.1 hypothetical protein AX018_107910 [Paracidovorax anthurii]
MYLVVIGWLYVTLMMAVAEASGPQGSLLGAAVTFVFYGLLPLSIVVYILGTPARKRALRERERRDAPATPVHAPAPPRPSASPVPADPDAGGEPPSGGAGAAHGGAVRKEP